MIACVLAGCVTLQRGQGRAAAGRSQNEEGVALQNRENECESNVLGRIVDE